MRWVATSSSWSVRAGRFVRCETGRVATRSSYHVGSTGFIRSYTGCIAAFSSWYVATGGWIIATVVDMLKHIPLRDGKFPSRNDSECVARWKISISQQLRDGKFPSRNALRDGIFHLAKLLHGPVGCHMDRTQPYLRTFKNVYIMPSSIILDHFIKITFSIAFINSSTIFGGPHIRISS